MKARNAVFIAQAIASLPYVGFFVLWSKITDSGEDATWLVVGCFFLLGYWTWVASDFIGKLRRGNAFVSLRAGRAR